MAMGTKATAQAKEVLSTFLAGAKNGVWSPSSYPLIFNGLGFAIAFPGEDWRSIGLIFKREQRAVRVMVDALDKRLLTTNMRLRLIRRSSAHCRYIDAIQILEDEYGPLSGEFPWNVRSTGAFNPGEELPDSYYIEASAGWESSLGDTFTTVSITVRKDPVPQAHVELLVATRAQGIWTATTQWGSFRRPVEVQLTGGLACLASSENS